MTAASFESPSAMVARFLREAEVEELEWWAKLSETAARYDQTGADSDAYLLQHCAEAWARSAHHAGFLRELIAKEAY
jgi:hypothetical protein